ncbi:hypothetical protein GCM10027185_29070 [Spirosoma pulveris]
MLGKKIGQNFIINIVSMGLGILSSVFIARVGGPTIMGNIGLAMSFQVLVKSIFTHTVNSVHLKMYNENNQVGLKNYMVVFVLYNVLTSLLVLSFVLWNNFSHNGAFTDLQISLIIIFILQDYLMTPFYIYITDQSSKLNIVRSNMTDFYAQTLINIAKIAAVLLGESEIGIAWYIMAACALGSVYPVINLIRSDFGPYSLTVVKKYIRYSMTISTSTIAYGLLVSFDKVLLGLYKVSPELIGFYNVGNRLGLLLMTLGISIGSILLSVFSKNATENNNDKTISQLSSYERFITISFLPAFLAASLFGNELITLVFGNRYLEAFPVLLLSILFAYVKILTIPYQNYLFANNSFRAFNRNSILFIVAIIFFSTTMAHFNFFNDLPISVAAALLLACLFERVLFTRDAAKIDPQIRLFFYPGTVLFFTALTVGWFVLNHFIPASNYLLSYGIRAVILLAILPVGYLLGIYTKGDFYMITSLLNIQTGKKEVSQA